MQLPQHQETNCLNVWHFCIADKKKMFPFDSVYSASNTTCDGNLLNANILRWKARLENFEDVEPVIFEYMECLGTVVELEDTYFKISRGLLKLRTIRHSHSTQLIFTERSELAISGLRKTSSADVENCNTVKDILSLALGIIGTIRNKRHMFVKENVRICLDSVDQLGQFINVSVKVDDSVENCVRILQIIQAKLQITHSKLIYSSYLDLLMPLALPPNDSIQVK